MWSDVKSAVFFVKIIDSIIVDIQMTNLLIHGIVIEYIGKVFQTIIADSRIKAWLERANHQLCFIDNEIVETKQIKKIVQLKKNSKWWKKIFFTIKLQTKKKKINVLHRYNEHQGKAVFIFCLVEVCRDKMALKRCQTKNQKRTLHILEIN